MRKHRYVGIILVNSERKVLLQLRDKTENYYPDCWTLPGGKIEEDESPEQAIVREVKEELDLNLSNPKLFKVVTRSGHDQIVERIFIYWCKISERIENLKLREGVALKYFPSNEISSLKIAFDLKPIIQELMETLIDNLKSA